MNRYRFLECEYAMAAHECEKDGRFPNLTKVNLEMAEYYANRADNYDARLQEGEE